MKGRVGGGTRRRKGINQSRKSKCGRVHQNGEKEEEING